MRKILKEAKNLASEHLISIGSPFNLAKHTLGFTAGMIVRNENIRIEKPVCILTDNETTISVPEPSIKAVQSALGHSSATMTLDTYSHLMSSDLGDAALRAEALISNTNENLTFMSQEAKSAK